MRIYYVMETRGRRCHVLSAVGVDARAWNRLYRRIREWRRRLEQRHGIPADGGLRPGVLANGAAPSCDCGCHMQPASAHETEVVAQGLRVVEDLAVETGGVQVVNVCLNMDETPAYRRVALDRLFNRVNATADREGGYAFLIFGQEPDETVVRTYERLRSHNPVPVRVGACGRWLAHPQPSHRPGDRRPRLPQPRDRLPAPGCRTGCPCPAMAGGTRRRRGRRRFHRSGPRPEPASVEERPPWGGTKMMKGREGRRQKERAGRIQASGPLPCCPRCIRFNCYLQVRYPRTPPPPARAGEAAPFRPPG